jgi:anti-sigma factor RsiW
MPSEDHLQDYIDGRLDAEAHAAVALELLARRDLAAEVDTLRRQNEALRVIGREILDEPIPERLRSAVREAAAAQARAGGRRRAPRLALAAAIALAGVAGGLGWFANELLRPRPDLQELIVADVADAFALYGSQGYPVDFPPERSADFASWIDRSLERQVPRPDLAAFGYDYHGGRLIPAEGVSIGVFQFAGAQDDRLVVFFWPAQAAPAQLEELGRRTGMAARFWQDGGLSFAVISAAQSPVFEEAANAVVTFFKTSRDSSRHSARRIGR